MSATSTTTETTIAAQFKKRVNSIAATERLSRNGSGMRCCVG
jgi:hypothetical protein